MCAVDFWAGKHSYIQPQLEVKSPAMICSGNLPTGVSALRSVDLPQLTNTVYGKEFEYRFWIVLLYCITWLTFLQYLVNLSDLVWSTFAHDHMEAIVCKLETMPLQFQAIAAITTESSFRDHISWTWCASISFTPFQKNVVQLDRKMICVANSATWPNASQIMVMEEEVRKTDIVHPQTTGNSTVVSVEIPTFRVFAHKL